ncbi:hypothetical protein ABB37_09440 [Leptomonas pyrrhocoris]|uniref:Flagellar attachment zone protein 1 conserved domain-containing protein n=1 Tax=Leptomonas pyrrhocoris TaxID=157538 RepID=A0A0N0DRI1_LEPPY|nr:hypothetical protein ABB37_09440 [Leptomonas pyrrhocoris]XP_015652620.1 hypothetical protein ABB37_09440 [Leptomonas pyrrhocoris]KPA74180.1 hypothetical protein ABB37_09440 [Leptomonas pyrrhocoris]KPA74181.1 hypothetical protein ABB37_09440 [Leptomonas pyrrhocoris]|eukprot:XP_015652619.1 hypothetical protein ABB37_09440 [Leptomonas pyrrhocoris]
MSRRESCVWHPMPDEVRRSSVQSRRASLAAGRRKSTNTNEPDWEVEAPPTPPHDDYTPRNGEAAAAAAGSAGAVAAAATQDKDHTPVENENAAGAAAEDREAAVSVKSEEPTEPSEGECALQGGAQEDAEASGRGRTRHIVRFHGDKWAKVLRKKRSEIEAAFLEDIKDSANVEAEEAKRVKIKMHECMEVTFVLYSESRARQKKIHAALQKYNFPKTCRIYTTFQA